jgi:hypothetical protein
MFLTVWCCQSLRDDVERDVLLFVGSVYQPNIDAAQRLIKLAPMLRDFEIVIAGPCGYYVQNCGT